MSVAPVNPFDSKNEALLNWEEDPDAAIEYLEGVIEESEALMDQEFEHYVEVATEEFEKAKEKMDEHFEHQMEEAAETLEADKAHHTLEYTKMIEMIQNGENPLKAAAKKTTPAKGKAPAKKTPTPKKRSVSLKKGSWCC